MVTMILSPFRFRNQLDAQIGIGRSVLKKLLKGISSVDSRLNEATLIFDDLKENFAGRLEEAAPALQCTSRKFDAN